MKIQAVIAFFVFLFIGLFAVTPDSYAQDYQVYGKVYDKATQQPLSGITILFKDAGVYPHVVRGTATTDAQGNYEVQVPFGWYYFYVQRNGYESRIPVGDSPGHMGTMQPIPAVSTFPTRFDFPIAVNPGYIYGVIKNSAGELLSGVNLEYGDIGVLNSLVTDSTGGYIFGDLDPGVNYWVLTHFASVKGVDYAFYIYNVTVQPGQAINHTIILQETATISGWVKDASENPVAQVAIAVEGVDDHHRGYENTTGTTSYQDYRFRFIPPGKTYRVTAVPAESSPYVIKSQSIDIPSLGGYTLNFVLDRTDIIRIQGVVRDKITNQPIAGLMVNYKTQSNSLTLSAQTDSQGKYSFTHLPAGESVQISVQGNSAYGAESISGIYNADSTVDFALVPASSISGVILDGNTNAPVANVRVETVNGNGGSSCVTGVDGQFNLTGLRAGVWTVRCTPAVNSVYEGVDNIFVLGEGENKVGVQIVLAAHASEPTQVDIYVHSKDLRPAANLRLRVDQKMNVVTDSSGHVQIYLFPGSYNVSLENSQSWVALPKALTIADSEARKDVQIVAYDPQAAAFIRGHINSCAIRNPASMMAVVAFPAGKIISADTVDNLTPITMAMADKTSSQYSLMLVPNYNYDLYLVAITALDNNRQSIVVSARSANIALGAILENMDIRDSLTSNGGTITGVFSSSATEGIRIYLWDEQGNFCGFTETEAEGTFIFNNVVPGDYIITAENPDRETAAVPPFSDGETVTVVGRIPVRAEIRVISPNGGEALTGESTYLLRWTGDSPDVDHVRLSYSRDGGVHYLGIGPAPNTGSYNWKVPNFNSTQVKIKIVAENKLSMSLGEGVSAGTFAITDGTKPTLPSISLHSPTNRAFGTAFTVSPSQDPESGIAGYDVLLRQGSPKGGIKYQGSYSNAGVFYNWGLDQPDGLYYICARARNNCGLCSEWAYAPFIYDNTAPAITISSIVQKGLIGRRAVIVVTGVFVENGSGIDWIKVNGNPAAISGKSFRYSLLLAANINTIIVTAQDKAYNAKATSVAIRPFYGNVNCDGAVSMLDIALIQLDVLGIRHLFPEQKARADVSGDGKVTALDIALIRRYLLGLIDKFPVEMKKR